VIVLSGAELVTPDRVLSSGTLIIDDGRIVEIRADAPPGGHSAYAFRDHYIVPGFIDVHMHGVDGIDSLDGENAVRSIAGRLPRYGVTAFCPTSVACAPEGLRCFLAQVREARATVDPRASRVLPAHLESNFINPAFRGAQPAACLRSPRAALDGPAGSEAGRQHTRNSRATDFEAADVLREIEDAAASIAIVTIAPELDGGLDLVRWLSARGLRPSIGHSNASYDEALAAIAAGARHATHLFNRMPPLHHRAPGMIGAILQADEVAAELICDGFHVHPALIRTAVAAKRPSRVFAITDGTAASGLPVGRRARLGGQPITAGESVAMLDDGTIAGSVLTMDRAFQVLVGQVGLSLVDAVTLCSATPARELGLAGHGALAPEAVADIVVLDAQFTVVQTYIAGQLVYTRH